MYISVYARPQTHITPRRGAISLVPPVINMLTPPRPQVRNA